MPTEAANPIPTLEMGVLESSMDAFSEQPNHEAVEGEVEGENAAALLVDAKVALPPRFLEWIALGGLLLCLGLTAITFCSARQSILASPTSAIPAVLGLVFPLSFLVFRKRWSPSWQEVILGFCFLAIGLGCALASTISGQMEVFWVGASSTLLSFLILYLREMDWSRKIVSALFVLFPIGLGSAYWQDLHNRLTDCIAWEASGLMDTLTIPHIRSSDQIQLSSQLVDMNQFTVSILGIEAILAIGFLLSFYRWDTLLVGTCVLLGIVPIWSGLVATAALLQMNALSTDTSLIFSGDALNGIVFGATLVAMLALEASCRYIFAPIPPTAIATEFPLIANLFNLVASYPESVHLPLAFSGPSPVVQSVPEVTNEE